MTFSKYENTCIDTAEVLIKCETAVVISSDGAAIVCDDPRPDCGVCVPVRSSVSPELTNNADCITKYIKVRPTRAVIILG